MKKQLLSCCLAALGLTAIQAQSFNEWKDPEVNSVNRSAMHTNYFAFASADEAKAGIKENSANFMTLNGLWKFNWVRHADARPTDFYQTNFNDKGWDDLQVPGVWELNGYGDPIYVNVGYAWRSQFKNNPPLVPTENNHVGSYRKEIILPADWKGKEIFAHFGSVTSNMYLWVNGRYVGYSEDSKLEAEFNLTNYLKPGKNVIAFQVFRWCDGSYLEDQDFFRFSGIYRDVYLYTVPDTHAYDLQIRAIPEENLDVADLEIKVKTWGKGSIVFRLEKDGECVLEEKKSLTEAGNEEADAEPFYIQKTNSSKTAENSFEWKINNPKLWSAEDPQLYDFTIELYDEAGTIQEVIPQKVGFRRFEMKNGIMTLNGKRIVFKGVNRHEFSSVSGRHVSEEELRKDLRIMKQNNINAIRTCHYPDTSLIYQLCDEYGIYMIDETNLESHGSWDVAEFTKDYTHVVPHNKPEWLDMMLDRANSMYQRDKNHPAILIWSCGNESFGGKDIYEMSQLFRKNDSTRLVHYEGLFHDRSYNDTSDMESQMYPSVEAIKEFLAKDDSKPFICCEYTHAMGNSCGAMHKYTDLTDTEPKYQGGFIWDYIDQSIYKKDIWRRFRRTSYRLQFQRQRNRIWR